MTATQTTDWRNRIVGEGEEAPDQLMAHPLNWRIHPNAQQAALEGVLDDVGWVQRIIVNKRTGRVVDGHLRISLALRHDDATVPVLYVDLDEREEALVLATLDPIAALAGADAEKLTELLEGVHTGDATVQAMLADLAERAGAFNLAEIDYSGDEDTRSGRTQPGQGAMVVSIGDLSALVDYDATRGLIEAIRDSFTGTDTEIVAAFVVWANEGLSSD
jgi:hypothetical protein